MAAVYLLAWTALDLLAGRFQAAEGVSLWAPPPALDLALLLFLGTRWTPLLLLSTSFNALLVTPPGLGVLPVAVLAVVHTCAYGGAAHLLLRVLRIDPRLPTQRDVVWLLAAGSGAAALLVAATHVVLLCQSGVVPWSELPTSVAGLWAGSATGIAMLAPVLLLAARHWTGGRTAGWPQGWTDRPPLQDEPAGSRVGRTETAAQVLVTGAALYVAYGGGPGTSLDYSYLVYAPLLWIAVRGGLRAAAPAVLLTNIGAVALNGGRVPGEGGIALQFGLVTLTVTGLLLGALIMQRRLDSDRHRHDALHDPLTGLPNRVLFTDRLEHAAARARRDPSRHYAVLFCDLDNFKQVNDTLGHHAGDELLVEVGRRLRTVTRPGDSLARLGGDEFAVLLDEIAEPAEVGQVTTRMLSVLAEPHRLDDRSGPVVVTASIGSALDWADGQDLLRDADVALNRAKRAGRHQHVAFDAQMRSHVVAGLHLETALRQALDEHQIDVVYQPVVDVPTGRVHAYEALARWTPPGGRPVPPSTFVALAERTGLIDVLGEQVLRTACHEAAGWPADDGPPPRLAVNVSPHELAAPGYGDRVLAVLAAAGLAPDRLDLEITETQSVGQSDETLDALGALAAVGVGLLVDDFGTGYSSFAYLHRLPVTGLKIDRSFVAGLPDDPQRAAIVQAVLGMAAELGLVVTAEGVEDQRQLTFLRRHRCPQAQGFLLGRPGPAHRT